MHLNWLQAKQTLKMFKGLCNNYLEGGGVTNQGGHRGKSQLERGGLDVKFNTYGGALLFSLFFTNWKSGRRASY